MKINLLLKYTSVYALIIGTSIVTNAQSYFCSDIFLKGSSKRSLDLEPIKWNDDLSFLKNLQRSESFGLVKSYYSKLWDTQVYFTATNVPNSKGTAPLVDSESKAVYLFIHGSGTMKSSGKNFIANMNTLAKLGYSTVSVDMPFHANGSHDARMYDANYFMEWLKNIVIELRKSGKPIYLAGHSFGPDIALEFATRYPKLLNGVVALSPASFNKTLDDWYQNFTTKMSFGGNVEENNAGGEWAYIVSKQFHWSKKKLMDPTKVNRDLRIRILSGDREEYVPAPIDPVSFTILGPNTYDIAKPLREVFSSAEITIEPGIGHYIFDHKDAQGNNVVLRELLAIDGIDTKDIKRLLDENGQRLQKIHISGQLEIKYVQDDIFKAWADFKYGKGQVLRIAKRGIDQLSQKILDEYKISQQDRNAEIYLKILGTKDTNPVFYQKFNLEGANPKKTDTTLFNSYLNGVLLMKSGQ